MKLYKKLSLLVICFAAVAMVLTGCGKPSTPSAFDAYAFLTKLDTTYSSRVAGTQGELDAGLYAKSELEKMGYTVEKQEFTYTRQGAEKTSQNFIAIKTGTSNVAKNTIVVGAHYDCAGIAHGISDNGGGVAVLLAGADYFKDHSSKYTIVFALWGAEEVGLQGSKAYVNNLTDAQLGKILLTINMDTVVGGDYNYVHASQDTLARAIQEACVDAFDDVRIQPGLNEDYPYGTAYSGSDHTPFDQKGIPYIYFESTNWEINECDGWDQSEQMFEEDGDGGIWHTPNDTLDFMDSKFPGRVKASLTTYTNVLVKILTDFVC